MYFVSQVPAAQQDLYIGFQETGISGNFVGITTGDVVVGGPANPIIFAFSVRDDLVEVLSIGLEGADQNLLRQRNFPDTNERPFICQADPA